MLYRVITVRRCRNKVNISSPPSVSMLTKFLFIYPALLVLIQSCSTIAISIPRWIDSVKIGEIALNILVIQNLTILEGPIASARSEMSISIASFPNIPWKRPCYGKPIRSAP